MDGKCIYCVGTEGKGPLQFSYPGGVAINKMTGQIYVVGRCNNHCVQVLNSDPTFSHVFGSYGEGQGQFDSLTDVTVDNEGFVYVADCGNHCIQKFTPEGQFVCSFGTKGSQPAGITVDDHGMLYVISCDSNNVSIFSPELGKCVLHKKAT